jgi:hypothetical protein
MRWTILVCLLLAYNSSTPWGFYAHKEINYLASFTLPTEMFGFYKQNIQDIKAWAVKPDQRRYLIAEEGIRHYIDLDRYERYAPLDTIPKHYDSAVAMYSLDTINAYGIVPWHIIWMKYRLTQAFKEKNYLQILKLSADLGHYIADAHVPLHTTKNYNGQLTNQHGIHGLWESRIPELFANDYNFFVGKAQYLEDPLNQIWQVIEESYAAKDSVLQFEASITSLNATPKYAFETKGKITKKVYSQSFSEKYHNLLNGMVERRMKKAILMVGNFWYTCWVDAGQPVLQFDLKNKVESFSGLDSNLILKIDSVNNYRTILH